MLCLLVLLAAHKIETDRLKMTCGSKGGTVNVLRATYPLMHAFTTIFVVWRVFVDGRLPAYVIPLFAVLALIYEATLHRVKEHAARP